MYAVVIHQDFVRRAFEILELSVVDRPDEKPGDHAYQYEPKGYEQKKDIHNGYSADVSYAEGVTTDSLGFSVI